MFKIKNDVALTGAELSYLGASKQERFYRLWEPQFGREPPNTVTPTSYPLKHTELGAS